MCSLVIYKMQFTNYFTKRLKEKGMKVEGCIVDTPRPEYSYSTV